MRFYDQVHQTRLLRRHCNFGGMIAWLSYLENMIARQTIRGPMMWSISLFGLLLFSVWAKNKDRAFRTRRWTRAKTNIWVDRRRVGVMWNFLIDLPWMVSVASTRQDEIEMVFRLTSLVEEFATLWTSKLQKLFHDVSNNAISFILDFHLIWF